MPIYVYKCPEGHRYDVYLKLSQLDEPQYCECGKPAKRQIVPTMINCDIQPWDYYQSPVTGKPVTSYKQRREDMERAGCVDYDPGMKRDYQQNIERCDRNLEKKVDETIEREIDKMPTDKKERLANELNAGMDCEYTRLETP